MVLVKSKKCVINNLVEYLTDEEVKVASEHFDIPEDDIVLEGLDSAFSMHGCSMDDVLEYILEKRKNKYIYRYYTKFGNDYDVFVIEEITDE